MSSLTSQKTQSYCFVIMSFSNNPTLQDYYEIGIKQTVESFGIDCIRVDELEHNERITDKVIGLIRNADFIIADLTEERPNCYYELGYSHALNKNVIHTVSEKSTIHFDVKDYNFIVYGRIQELKERLKKRIEATISDKPRESLDDIVLAIQNFEEFSKKHKEKMLKARITQYPVQKYASEDSLPAPLNGSFEFHVKDGLLIYGDAASFNKEDGGFYRLKEKKKGWGHITHVPEFEGLIARSEDIDLLINKIEQSFDAALQKLN